MPGRVRSALRAMARWWRAHGHAVAGALLAGALLVAALPPLVAHPGGATAIPASPSLAGAPAGNDGTWRQGMWGTRSPLAPTATTSGAIPGATSTSTAPPAPTPTPTPPGSAQAAFASAAQTYNVPVPLLEALCYMEGRLSNQGGRPSLDNGFGCMHLVDNTHADTLDQAAHEIGVAAAQLKTDIAANIRGGAAILRDDALLASGGQLPATLADWYGAVAIYSGALAPSTARLYADTLYRVLNAGFSAQAETGETITLAPQGVQPNTAIPHLILPKTVLPAGCRPTDANVDYPGAIDCILPTSFDCIPLPPQDHTCTYEDANRPTNPTLSFVVIHDIEGTAQSALNVFQDINSGVSIHYIVDTDGTVYQVLHEKDIAYQAGNYWYNQHSIGIEHAGYDATGYQWYNATEYLASAKLVAYLLQKYHIPLDHNHIVAHGTIPSPSLAEMPNHEDPGPYWMWGYYFDLIHSQGVPYPAGEQMAHMVMLFPRTAEVFAGSNGTETASNFNFFYLYKGPSTASGRIPRTNLASDITDVTDNVEPVLTYYYLNKVPDPAGSGDTMYEVWYAEDDQTQSSGPNYYYTDARLVWLAVPPGDARDGSGPVLAPPWVPQGALVQLNDIVVNGISTAPVIYGEPTTAAQYVIGSGQNDALFVATMSYTEDGTTNLWYEVNVNHRQGWVPASEVTVLQYPPGGLG